MNRTESITDGLQITRRTHMQDIDATFFPDYATPPGDTVLDVIEERGWSIKEFSRRIHWSHEYTLDLVNGREEIDRAVAEQLVATLGGTVDFWLERERIYRERRKQINKGAGKIGENREGASES